MIRNLTFIYYLLLTAAFISSCETTKEKKVEQPAEEQVQRFVPNFNADSAFAFIQKQVDFGPRVPNSKEHVSTGNWIINKFESLGWTVQQQHFEANSFDNQHLYLRNIIASYGLQQNKRLLLAAHWDTRPYADKDNERTQEPIDGANDGASGVGVLIEIARTIAANDSLDIGVDIILFDGEDWGETGGNYTPTGTEFESWWCLGSQYWAKNKHRSNYSAYYGILLDMVGGKNATFLVEGYSQQFAPSIVKKVWDNGRSLGYGQFFINQQGGAITDDHYFVNKLAKIPMIDIIPTDLSDGGFGNFHHTHQDSMDVISKSTLKAVGQTVLYTIYNE